MNLKQERVKHLIFKCLKGYNQNCILQFIEKCLRNHTFRIFPDGENCDSYRLAAMYDSLKGYEIQKSDKVVDFAFQITPQCKVCNFSYEYALQRKQKTDMLKFAYPLIIILLISFADSEISTAIYPLSYANSAFSP